MTRTEKVGQNDKGTIRSKTEEITQWKGEFFTEEFNVEWERLCEYFTSRAFVETDKIYKYSNRNLFMKKTKQSFKNKSPFQILQYSRVNKELPTKLKGHCHQYLDNFGKQKDIFKSAEIQKYWLNFV